VRLEKETMTGAVSEWFRGDNGRGRKGWMLANRLQDLGNIGPRNKLPACAIGSGNYKRQSAANPAMSQQLHLQKRRLRVLENQPKITYHIVLGAWKAGLSSRNPANYMALCPQSIWISPGTAAATDIQPRYTLGLDNAPRPTEQRCTQRRPTI